MTQSFFSLDLHVRILEWFEKLGQSEERYKINFTREFQRDFFFLKKMKFNLKSRIQWEIYSSDKIK